jgi:hypothetical protein
MSISFNQNPTFLGVDGPFRGVVGAISTKIQHQWIEEQLEIKLKKRKGRSAKGTLLLRCIDFSLGAKFVWARKLFFFVVTVGERKNANV